MTSRNEIPTATRTAIKKRDMDTCLRCGMRMTEIQHRQRRREGGHGKSNLACICRTCHVTVHKNVTAARVTGWVVPTYVENVWEVPLKTFGGWVLLNDDGTVTHLDREAVPDERVG